MENLGIGSRISHPNFGKGVIVQVKSDSYEISFIEYGVKNISRDFEEDFQIIERVDTPDDLVSFDKLEKRIVKILKKYSDINITVPLGRKWEGGIMILRPGDDSLKEKEIPIETFFHKIVMVRDRLRVMEQRINSSDLTDEEKVGLQQYITRIYGSLTTFNVLFAGKDDQFRGERS